MAETMAHQGPSSSANVSAQSMRVVEAMSQDDDSSTSGMGASTSSAVSVTVQSVIETLTETQEEALREPLKKKAKMDTPGSGQHSPKRDKTVEKLECRLGGILCCAVCLDLPRTAIYQVNKCRNFTFIILTHYFVLDHMI